MIYHWLCMLLHRSICDWKLIDYSYWNHYRCGWSSIWVFRPRRHFSSICRSRNGRKSIEVAPILFSSDSFYIAHVSDNDDWGKFNGNAQWTHLDGNKIWSENLTVSKYLLFVAHSPSRNNFIFGWMARKEMRN